MNFGTFYFEKYQFDSLSGEAKFFYNFDKSIFFEESIFFYDTNFPLIDTIDFSIVDNLLFHIHLALGMSYYKCFPTKELVVQTGFLDDFQISFWKKFYKNGLGEFFFTNQLNPNEYLNFINQGNETTRKSVKKNTRNSQKILVPIGGGKDSITSIELLKKGGFEFDLVTFSSKENILYENTEKISGKKRLRVKRILSENLKKVSELGGYNGHVAITGMIAFVLELSCYLYNYTYIILSNERSANYGNTLWNGMEVNHQWSKSEAFERDFGEYVEKYIAEYVKYFSLLRPFYEIQIAQLFSQLGEKYFSYFSSCNTNFKIFSSYEKKGYWCNTCPKCAFVYSIIRPYINQEQTLEIFGKELYSDSSLLPLFRELLGISGIKPFECVGESEEVIYAMKGALMNWKGEIPYILEIFQQEIETKIEPNYYKKLEEKWFDFSFKGCMIPELFKKHLFNNLITPPHSFFKEDTLLKKYFIQ